MAPRSASRTRTPRPTRPARADRSGGPRRATHSLEQILSTAIAILDRDGVKGLTLRGLAGELGGGLGSVYWYVDGKDEVMSLACDAVVGAALSRAESSEPFESLVSSPELEAADPAIGAALTEVRRTAMALFEQTQLHPWLAPQLQVQGPGAANSLRFWERLGRSMAAMGLSPRQQFHGSTAMIGYIVGVAAEMAAQDLHADPTRSQAEQLDEFISQWIEGDQAQFPWIQSIAEEFRIHDDASQFAAGLDLFLGGLLRQAVEVSDSKRD